MLCIVCFWNAYMQKCKTSQNPNNIKLPLFYLQFHKLIGLHLKNESLNSHRYGAIYYADILSIHRHKEMTLHVDKFYDFSITLFQPKQARPITTTPEQRENILFIFAE